MVVSPTLRHCFNRTFMELKLLLTIKKYFYDLFQSYLYGIEIMVLVFSANSVVGFNRTFMELKSIANCI